MPVSYPVPVRHGRLPRYRATPGRARTRSSRGLPPLFRVDPRVRERGRRRDTQKGGDSVGCTCVGWSGRVPVAAISRANRFPFGELVSDWDAAANCRIRNRAWRNPAMTDEIFKNSMSRRTVLKGGAATGAAVLLAGIGQASADAVGGQARATLVGRNEGGTGTLIISVPTAPDIFDPHATGGWDTYKHTLQMFEGLSREILTDPNSTFPVLEPCLAESWDISEDNLTYTFHLRQGVTFHDGTAFNAQAVEFNVRRIWDKDFEYYYARANSFTFYAFEALESITVVDDYTVEMKLSSPFAEFLRMQNQSYGEPLMISPTAVQTHGNEGFAQNPAGTGRFKLVERAEGESTTIERFAGYWGPDPAKLDKVIFRIIGDSQAA